MKQVTITIHTTWTVHGEPTEEQLRTAAWKSARHIDHCIVGHQVGDYSLPGWSITRDTLHVDLDLTKPEGGK